MFVDNPTIGADIEVFLRDKESQEIVSAEGIIKGSKYEPFHFDPENPYYATSLDNVMAEFCIPPAQTPYEFYKNVQYAIDYINKNIPANLETVALPAVRVHPRFLQTENAQLFGCEPDFNAWSELQNPTPTTGTNLRSCGGHIHIGYEMPRNVVNLMLVKAMDIFVGVPSILLEDDNERKALYGKAGAFREKKYGVEYRTISNYYLQSQGLTEWVVKNTLEAVEFVNNRGVMSLSEDRALDIQNAINHNDKNLAREIVAQFNVKLAA